MPFTLLGSRFSVRVQVRVFAALAALLLCATTAARAEVTRVEIISRADLSYAGYEKIVGRVFFAVDPADPRNAVIADIDKAPRNANGRVEFSADFYAVRPKTGGNGVAIVDVVNRGNRVTRMFNRVTAGSDPDVGDGFLLRRGFTVIAIGWEFDLPAGGDLLRIRVPAADGATGIVRTLMEVDRRAPTVRLSEDLPAYPPVDPAGSDTALTVRDRLSDAPQAIPRTQWQLSGDVVSLDGGFEPGRVYEIAFRVANPPVAGLGLAAVRDIASWAKHAPDAVTPAKYVYGHGQSQTGRFLREFLYLGFNADEQERLVFDGVIAHIAGGARIDINRRGSTPTAGNALVGTFPFSDRAQRDPVTGVTEGLLENDRARRHQPKLFLTNSSVEYWIDTGRAAALIHTTPDGTRDAALGDNVRAYLFAGAQHTPGPFPPAAGGRGQQRANPLDYTLSLRALLVALDRWVKDGVAPPPSRHPRFADRTLVRAQALAFPAIPEVQSPRIVAPGRRAANALLPSSGGEGAVQPLLVSQVDADGNEMAGIRLPEVAVPLATYTGWNFRNPQLGGIGRLVGNTGSYVPFARTQAEREARRDPRPSIDERYPSRGDYLAKVRQVTEALVRDRYMLAEDVDTVVNRASEHWELLTRTATTSASAR
ncbi:MAG TPA: alpha/beta hydrolase domain-containing protein [Vicinamibacterales bacterium]